MKKFFLAIVIALSTLNCFAGQPQGGIFKHVGIGVGAGLNGVSVELSSPITRWVQMRAGVSIMPNFKLTTDADVDYSLNGYSESTTIDLEGAFGRTQGSLYSTFIRCPGDHSMLPEVCISAAISSLR